MLSAQRIAIRDDRLDAISLAARLHGATALHLFGSLGRGAGDALSDIDVWLTFPDVAITNAVRDRWSLYEMIGPILLAHEMTPNRPPGGIYTLALYSTSAGPIQVDWYLAPQYSSRVDPPARPIYVDVDVLVGSLPADVEAEHAESRSERISWLICMLFIAGKMIVRGESQEFGAFLGEAYREVCKSYLFEETAVTNPVSLAAVGTMLRQLETYADAQQRRALTAIDEFWREFH